jgi:hypothetical protein
MPNDENKAGHPIKVIESGNALKKGVSQLREGQKSEKPAGLARPKGVVVPPVPAKTTDSGSKLKE